MKKYKIIALVLAGFIGVSATVVNNDKLFEIAKNIELFVDIYKQLNAKYVDEIDPNTLMKTGIDAMVNSLDPYTMYWSDSEIESVRINNERKYIAIGASIDKIKNSIIITDVNAEGQAAKEGVLSGDIILKINGQSTEGMDLDKVKALMKGVKGAKMNLLLKRPGLKDAFAVAVERSGENKTDNVPYFGRVGKDVGYVNLSTFTADASKNIKNAIAAMNEKRRLKGVVLDLRYNGGGLLREAIAVSNLFIEKGKKVVYTKSKIKGDGKTYRTRKEPFDKEVPLVVLINKRSASASEIVSGVIQDYDRGVLIGQRSFGKGLVQNRHMLGYNAQMKLTTHRYYIPSKRCIQGYKYIDGKAVDIDEKDRSVFQTESGRKVYDGGGVSPDIPMNVSERSAFTEALVSDNVFFDYINEYVAKHKKIAPADKFEFKDYKQFVQFVVNKFSYQSHLEKELGILLEDEKLSDTEKSEIKTLIANVAQDEQQLLQQNQSEIETAIAAAIVERYYFRQGKVQYQLRNDAEVKKAIEILENPTEYNKILGK